MKYTRYNIRRRKPAQNNLISIVFIVLLLAFILASLFFKVFYNKGKVGDKLPDITNNKNELNKVTYKKNGDNIELKKRDSSTQDEAKNEAKEIKKSNFYIIQCGAFKNIDNAKLTEKKLSSYEKIFIIKEGEVFKLIIGIYNDKEINQVLSSLSKNKIENSKIKLSLLSNDLCNEEIVENLNANIGILNKLKQKSVKGINTEQLKKWNNDLKQVDKNHENYKKLEELKKHTNNLPIEMKKNILEENYKYIYNFAKSISIK